MGKIDSIYNAGESPRLQAVEKTFDGSNITPNTATITITQNMTSKLIDGAAMTESSACPGVMYYTYTTPAAGIYYAEISFASGAKAEYCFQVGSGELTAARVENLDDLDTTVSSRLADSDYTAPDNLSITDILADTNELQTNQGNWITADLTDVALETSVQSVKTKTDNLPNDPAASSEISALNDITAADVWANETRTLTSASGITESDFIDFLHTGLNSYVDSLPAGVTPGVAPAPDNANLVRVFMNIYDNEDVAISTITPIIKIIGAYYWITKYFKFDPVKYLYSGGQLSFQVPEYCKISVLIRELNYEKIGYVGIGGSIIDVHDLYADDQTP